MVNMMLRTDPSSDRSTLAAYQASRRGQTQGDGSTCLGSNSSRGSRTNRHTGHRTAKAAVAAAAAATALATFTPMRASTAWFTPCSHVSITVALPSTYTHSTGEGRGKDEEHSGHRTLSTHGTA